MGIYYTKKCSTLLEKVGFTRKYMAIEVCPQDQSLVFLNTNERVPVDAITKIKWEANLKLKMVLTTAASTTDKVCCVRFEQSLDLQAFLRDLNLDIPVEVDNGGAILSGTYAPRPYRASERASEVLASILDNMRSNPRRRNSKSASFDRGSTGRRSLEFLRGAASRTY
ncbi:hypothetical protein AC1031_003520 [Aphanomyces cochlioides]|nr:hypothetical protein AC1031_003520 [Aphanomyces cochlioides]